MGKSIISLEKAKQGKVQDKIRRLKSKIKKGKIVINNDAPKRKKRFTRRPTPTKLEESPQRTTGVVYLGHIPHGFYEKEIYKYCSQFGHVIQVRVARSKKNGRSRGYAFIEFEDVEVAQIFADTTNNYLMFDRLLACQYIPPEKRHRRMFDVMNTADTFLVQESRDYDKKKKLRSGERIEGKRDVRRRRKIEEMKELFEKRGLEFNVKVHDPRGILNAAVPRPDAVVIDESDDEIQFNVPAHVKKVFKKSDVAGATKAGKVKA